MRESFLTTGEKYTGIQQYQGNGIMRYCCRCQCHRPVGGGRMAGPVGFKYWICNNHPVKTNA